MRFSIDVGSELELRLYQAVLLYRNGPRRRSNRQKWCPNAGRRTVAQHRRFEGDDPTAWHELHGRVSARLRFSPNAGANCVVDGCDNPAYVLPRRL